MHVVATRQNPPSTIQMERHGTVLQAGAYRAGPTVSTACVHDSGNDDDDCQARGGMSNQCCTFSECQERTEQVACF